MKHALSLAAVVLLLILGDVTRASEAGLPPGEAGAKATLEASPRHGEYADLTVEGRQTPLRAYVVYPETRDTAPVVIVIHEIYGLTDWIRAVADQLAADGFIAIAPDLLSGEGPGGGATDAFTSREDVVKAVRSLTPERVDADLEAVRAYGAALPASNGKAATVGFCWGGAVSFRAATNPQLSAAVVYYGSSPGESEVFERIHAPVLGLYGSDDARVNKTIEPADEAMQRQGKTFEHHIYDGAGHGFLRQQDGRDGANLRASKEAWPQMLRFLREHTR